MNIISEVKRIDPYVDVIMLTKFGSHLYGTDTPNSDTDYKGVFMPSKRMMCLGAIPKAINNNRKKKTGEKNTADDTDFELYSLHYFIKLACDGETVALDMLHATDLTIVKRTPLWDELAANRHKFYTRNLRAFVEYARRQAAKYGVKGSRLHAVKEFMDYLAKTPCITSDRMSVVWDNLPNNEHSRFIETNPNGIRQYQICGKIIQESMKVGYAFNIMENFYREYGDRARKAEANEGIDWKAVSHALRAAYQVRDVLTVGTIIFPLAQAGFLRDVKTGSLDYLTQVAPVLEDLMSEVEELSAKSTLPEKANVKWWEDWIYNYSRKFICSPWE